MNKKLILSFAGLLVAAFFIVGITAVGGFFKDWGDRSPVGYQSEKGPEQNQGEGHELFTAEFKGLKLVSLTEGEEAIQQISQLHGTKIDIDKGFIAVYQGDSGQMIFWVSDSRTEEEAQSLLDIMNEKMPASKVFGGLRKETIDGQEVFYVFGMDMDHYYYRIEKRVYWVGFTEGTGEKLISEVLKTYR